MFTRNSIENGQKSAVLLYFLIRPVSSSIGPDHYATFVDHFAILPVTKYIAPTF